MMTSQLNLQFTYDKIKLKSFQTKAFSFGILLVKYINKSKVLELYKVSVIRGCSSVVEHLLRM